MGKDVDDQQGRQQDEGVGDPETVGRRFKPDLGHHRTGRLSDPAASSRESLHITQAALTRDATHGSLSICALSYPR